MKNGPNFVGIPIRRHIGSVVDLVASTCFVITRRGWEVGLMCGSLAFPWCMRYACGLRLDVSSKLCGDLARRFAGGAGAVFISTVAVPSTM